MGIDSGTASSWLFTCLDKDLEDAVMESLFSTFLTHHSPSSIKSASDIVSQIDSK